MILRLSAVKRGGRGDEREGGITNDPNERWCYSMSLASLEVVC